MLYGHLCGLQHFSICTPGKVIMIQEFVEILSTNIGIFMLILLVFSTHRGNAQKRQATIMKISHDDQSSKEIFYGKWHRKSQDKNMHFVEHWLLKRCTLPKNGAWHYSAFSYWSQLRCLNLYTSSLEFFTCPGCFFVVIVHVLHLSGSQTFIVATPLEKFTFDAPAIIF